MKGVHATEEHKTRSAGLQLLRQKSVQGAAHDSTHRFPPVRCHPATRRTVVSDALRWFYQRPSAKSNLLWLHGVAGSGKTALAQTICESLSRTGHLGASFFFSCTAHDRGRVDLPFLFTTIAYQLSLALPLLAPYIEEAILQDPTLVNKTPPIQFQKLILEPFCRLGDNESRPTAIVIDGLDECPDEDAQIHLLESIVSSMNDQVHLLSFIITSRPSPRVCTTFSKAPISDRTYAVPLTRSMDTDRDIRAYLSARLVDIREDPKHKGAMASVPSTWPGEDVISYLVEISSGLFLYAATVVKFVDDPGSHPAERLSAIASLLSLSPAHSAVNLDVLYSHILGLAPDRPRMLDILGAIIAMRDSAHAQNLAWRPGRDVLTIAENLLDLQEDDGYTALLPIHSLVAIREPAIGSKDELDEEDGEGQYVVQGGLQSAVQFYHHSLLEFLCDRSRAGEYFIDMKKLNARLAVACIRRLETLSLLPNTRINDVTWGYSLLNWTAHVTASETSEQVVVKVLQDFDYLGCYIATLTSAGMNSGLVNDIKRLALSPKSLLQTLRSRLRSERNSQLAGCPKPLDITRGRNVMLRTSAHCDITESGYQRCLQDLLAWLKAGTNPSKNLCSQLQFVINVLDRHQHLGTRKLIGPKFDPQYHRGIHYYAPTEF